MSPQFRTPSIDTAAETEYVSWSSPAADLWVAATPSAYVGMVDKNHDGFVATGHMGADLGVHATMEAARTAVYSAWSESAPAQDDWAPFAGALDADAPSAAAFDAVA